MRSRRLVGWSILVVLALAGWWAVSQYVWPYPVLPQAEAALSSTERVDVSTEAWLTFTPVEREPPAGLILYPGARVRPEAYAPVAHAIAEQGFLVVIVSMPLNFPALGANRASEAVLANPEVVTWVIGGHGEGGALAARYAAQNSAIRGVLLLAAAPDSGVSLSGRKLPLTALYATEDGLFTPADMEAARRLLPDKPRLVEIEGGNHVQFGWYGPIDGDNRATITREEQQAIAVDEAVRLLRQVS